MKKKTLLIRGPKAVGGAAARKWAAWEATSALQPGSMGQMGGGNTGAGSLGLDEKGRRGSGFHPRMSHSPDSGLAGPIWL